MGFSVDQLVADCVAAVQGVDGHSGVAVEEVLARVISDSAAIEAAIGHPRDLAVFSTWFNSEELTLLHIVWPPAIDLMPHDHLMWAAIGLYAGREDNRLFRPLPDGSIEHRRTKTLRSGDSLLLGDDAIHAVANPSREWTGAIHVYGGDFFRGGNRTWSDPGQASMPYDVDVQREALNHAAIQAKKRELSE